MSKKTYPAAKNIDELNPTFEALNMRAGWNKKEPSLWKEPKVNYYPMHWSWDVAKEGLIVAAPLISTELTERRHVFLVNPIENNHYDTLRTLVCAYQMICPKETARSHRHSPNALRFVLSAGKDVFTVVDGERLDMHDNDIVLTPGNMWHGHANEGDSDAFWIDFLDVPLVHLLEPMFFEHWPQGYQIPECANVSQEYIFKWKDVEQALKLDLQSTPEKTWARKILNAPSLPTMQLSMTMFQPQGKTDLCRSTENQIVAVVEGEGFTDVGGERFQWKRGDVIAIPCWQPFKHQTPKGATLLTVSDAKMQMHLGLFKTEQLSENH